MFLSTPPPKIFGELKHVQTAIMHGMRDPPHETNHTLANVSDSLNSIQYEYSVSGDIWKQWALPSGP